MIEVVVAVDVEFEARVVSALGTIPDIEVIRRPADEVELLAAGAAGVGDVVVLGQHFLGADAEVVRRLHAHAVRVLGLADDPAVLTDWGVPTTVSPWATPEELAAAVRAAAAAVPTPPRPAEPPRTAGGGAPGPVIAVWGTGGAPGRSTVAAALAHTLARTAGPTVLVDADTVAASQAALLGLLDDAPQIAALCRAAASGGTAAALARHVSAIDEHFAVVTGLSRAERWPEVRPGVLAEVLTALARAYTCTVVDVSDRVDPDDPYADPHYDRHGATRAVLDRADHVVVVAAGDPIGLQRLVRLLETERGIAVRDDCTVVVNRVRAGSVGPGPEARIRATLERFAGLTGVHLVPDDRAAADAALLAGRTLTESAPHSAASRAVTALAGLLPVPDTPDAPPRRSRRRGRRRMGA
ncbi:MinD-like ATPase involved in chromosome partitioning or flagellar assembly [Brevibacterium pityocampae]